MELTGDLAPSAEAITDSPLEHINYQINAFAIQQEIKLPIDISTIFESQNNSEKYENLLENLGINPNNPGFRNVARALNTISNPATTDTVAQHHTDIVNEFWENLVQNPGQPNQQALEKLLAPDPLDTDLDQETKQRIQALFTDNRETDVYEKIVILLRFLNENNAGQTFFEVAELPDTTFGEVSSQAKTIVERLGFLQSQQELFAKLLTASTHTTDRKYTPETQLQYAHEVLHMLLEFQQHYAVLADTSFNDQVINELDIIPGDTIRTRLQKMSQTLSDYMLPENAPRAKSNLVNPKLREYYTPQKMDSNFGRINQDFPGFAMGGPEFWRRNQVIEIEFPDRSIYYAVIHRNASHKRVWNLSILGANGVFMTQEEIAKNFNLGIVDQASFSCAQLSAKRPCTHREVPVHLFRAALGLEQKKMRPEMTKTFPYVFPEITSEEISSIKSID